MFDGNGNWTSDFSAQADRDNGIKILASRFDNIFIADIKESFENCLTKDGQIAPIGNFNMGGQKITNLNNGVNDNDAVNMSQLNNTISSSISSSVSNLLSSLYPVGSIYIGTQNTCPLASLISGSQWQLVAQDRALWGGNGSNGNTTIAAGLPNITSGKWFGIYANYDSTESTPNSAVRRAGDYKSNGSAGSGDARSDYNFSASRSSSIYGQSSTVQPPAYRVNVWRRTA
jgi:hypothetical protein